MEITEVRIKLMEDSDDRLQGFCSITFDDCFVVRDLKIIDGTNGPFVAMPSRKLTHHCGKCGSKNHLRANFCNQCGERQRRSRDGGDSDGRAKLYADIAHPINSQCRETIQDRVIAEFQDELERAKLPGYQSRYDDDYDAGSDVNETSSPSASSQRQSEPGDSDPSRSTQSGLKGPHRRVTDRRESERVSGRESGEESRKSRRDDKGDSFGAGVFD